MDYKALITRSITSVFLLSICLFVFAYYQSSIINIFRIIYVIIFFEIIFFFKLKKIISILYLFLSLFFLEIYFFLYLNFYYFLYFVFLIAIFDIFSYIFGSFFGKKKIVPNISPGKTYEGLILGFFISIIFSNIFYFFISQIFH
jgi:phosphatidate cytidylyltransferase